MESPYKLFLDKFGSFTEIQEKAMAPLEARKNCLITAPTGSGKTEAVMLPVLNRLMKYERKKGIRVIYITPLRALNRDLIKRLVGMCAEVGVSVDVRHGDTKAGARKKQSENPPEVLITTPESLQNIFLSKKLRAALGSLSVVIVDEVHELYYNKRGAQLSIALERLSEYSGDFQRIGISATVGAAVPVARFLFGKREHELVRSSKAKEFRIVVEMPVAPRREYREFRQQFGLDQQSLARIERVADLISSSKASIVFVNTRQVAESLGSKLIQLGKAENFGRVGIHHSSLDKEERIIIENAFKEGGLRAIIATSSLELGIDIGRVDRVVQYGSPKQAIRLIQRIGRGGHREDTVASGNILVAGTLEGIEAGVISDFASAGALEGLAMEANALDVLVNQVCAIALEYRSIGAGKAFEIVRRAAPYSELERASFDRILAFMADSRLITFRDGRLGVGGRGIGYFINTISVIPDTSRFLVKNVVTNRIISTLDEKFVYNYIDSGSSFITKGLPWKVVSIEEGVIFAEPGSDMEAAVPDWDGEDIPVSKMVAQAVFEKMADPGSLHGFMDEETLKRIKGFSADQKGFFIPEGSRIFIEELENYALIYAPLGKLANEFLAKIIGAIVFSEVGAGASIRATPYAIIVNYDSTSRRADLKRVIGALSHFNFYENAGMVTGSELFRYKFVQVAKLFGVVDKKATITKSGATKLISFYKDSQIFGEVIRDLNKNYFDAPAVFDLIERIKEGQIKVEVIRSPGSPLSHEILRSAYHYKELLLPSAPTESEVASFKEKFREKEIQFICTYCGLIFNEEVGTEIDMSFLCHNCRSPLLALNSLEKAEVFEKKKSGKRLGQKESVTYDEMIVEAGLISAYGNRAVIALSTYGVGTATAARILKNIRKEYKHFFADLIDAQKTFVRTKKFWKAG